MYLDEFKWSKTTNLISKYIYIYIYIIKKEDDKIIFQTSFTEGYL